MSADYEKLGAFYLGRRHDLSAGETTSEMLLYDSKDLTTHAVVVGMTGSGKTGLCLDLLEEAAIDGIPAIAIDPKGDIGNLLLTFPDLAPEDFRPWIDESQAMRSGVTPDEFAAQTAAKWRDGLAKWDQGPDRIQRLRDKVDLAIYTPGSSAGRPLTVLQSFAAPSQKVRDDADMMRDRVSSAASGLLALLGIDADPVTSRDHILIANLFQQSWSNGQDLSLADLFRLIQEPPFEQVGILDLETFYPSKDRQKLAMQLNNLLASPAFAGWLDGEPLDIHQLLTTRDGKPRVSVLSIAHLSDTERMFFVTILLNEVLSWMRSQPGTSSLRAILYMDEVFGFFPPTANPPSKLPMLTLLKQARAFGLGCVLATQNPVDLDYKGLSNTGTWFLGRLQTERDKMRVLEGLEGASAQAGSGFNRQEMEKTLAALGSRVFLMNNVHDNEPVIFETRWALSYLRGPLTRDQIKRLTDHATLSTTLNSTGADPVATGSPSRDSRLKSSQQNPPAPSQRPEGGVNWSALKPVTPRASQSTAHSNEEVIEAVVIDPSVPPELPDTIPQSYLQLSQQPPLGTRLIYSSALLVRCQAHYVRVGYQIDGSLEVVLLVPPEAIDRDVDWPKAIRVKPSLLKQDSYPNAGGEFTPLPAALTDEQRFARFSKEAVDHVYRNCPLELWYYAPLKEYSRFGELRSEFRTRLAVLLNEQRERELEKVKAAYGEKLDSLQRKIDDAESRVQREKAEYRGKTMDSMVNVGGSLLGALLGRKLVSKTNVTKASIAMKSMSRSQRERGDVKRAEKELEKLNKQLTKLDGEFKKEVAPLQNRPDASELKLESLELQPRKGELQIEQLAIAWVPMSLDPSGMVKPLSTLQRFEV